MFSDFGKAVEIWGVPHIAILDQENEHTMMTLQQEIPCAAPTFLWHEAGNLACNL